MVCVHMSGSDTRSVCVCVCVCVCVLAIAQLTKDFIGKLLATYGVGVNGHRVDCNERESWSNKIVVHVIGVHSTMHLMHSNQDLVCVCVCACMCRFLYTQALRCTFIAICRRHWLTSSTSQSTVTNSVTSHKLQQSAKKFGKFKKQIPNKLGDSSGISRYANGTAIEVRTCLYVCIFYHTHLVSGSHIFLLLSNVNALGNLSRLLLHRCQNIAGLVVKSFCRVIIPNVVYGITNHLLIVHHSSAADLTKDDDHPGFSCSLWGGERGKTDSILKCSNTNTECKLPSTENIFNFFFVMP